MLTVTIKTNTLELSPDLVTKLNAKPGDRISIEYTDYKKNLTPLIQVSDVGNKLTNKNTIVFKGMDKDFLSQYGTTFNVVEVNGTLFLQGDQPFKVYTSVSEAIENYLDMSILQDTNYNIEKYKSYEL
jgi:hypothetical protein